MCLIDIRRACASTANGSYGFVDFITVLAIRSSPSHSHLSNLDAIATEEWKKEVLKHEQYIKDLEENFKTKCEAMKVFSWHHSEQRALFLYLSTMYIHCILTMQFVCHVLKALDFRVLN